MYEGSYIWGLSHFLGLSSDGDLIPEVGLISEGRLIYEGGLVVLFVRYGLYSEVVFIDENDENQLLPVKFTYHYPQSPIRF